MLSAPSPRLPRSHRRLACLAVLCAAFVSVSSHAQQALTLDQALRAAQERSRQLVAQDSAASASREMAIAAGQLPDPTLKAGVNNLPINGPDRFSLTRDFMTMRSIGVAQEITRSDKLKARSARFGREAEAAEAACAADRSGRLCLSRRTRLTSRRLRRALRRRADRGSNPPDRATSRHGQDQAVALGRR